MDEQQYIILSDDTMEVKHVPLLSNDDETVIEDVINSAIADYCSTVDKGDGSDEL